MRRSVRPALLLAFVGASWPVLVRAATDPCAGLQQPELAWCQAQNAPGSIGGSIIQGAAGDAEKALTEFFVNAATWVLNQIDGFIQGTTSPNLDQAWFKAHFVDMLYVAYAVVPLFLLIALVQTLIQADLKVAGRALGNLVLVAMFTSFMLTFAQLSLGATDELSSFVSRNSLTDIQGFLGGMAKYMSAAMTASDATGAPGMPLGFIFLAALATVIGGILVWLELLVRTLAVYLCLLFLPVTLAAAVWPSLGHMVRRLLEILAALILSKFVIVVVIAAGAAALNAAVNPPGGAAPGNDGSTGATLLLGGAMVGLAAYAPWRLLKLIPVMEAHAIAHMGGLGRETFHNVQRNWSSALRHGRSMTDSRPDGPLKLADQPVAAGAGAAGGGGLAAAAGPIGAAAMAARGGLKIAGDHVGQAGSGQTPAPSSGTGGSERKPLPDYLKDYGVIPLSPPPDAGSGPGTPPPTPRSGGVKGDG